MTWTTFGPNTPRFVRPNNWLLTEGQRTNAVRNPRGEGLVPGTPGTVPADWGAYSAPAGVTRSIVGVGTESGIDYVDVSYSGTAATGFTLDMNPLGDAFQPAASAGQTWTVSTFARLLSGTMPDALQVRIQGRNAANQNTADTSGAFVAVTNAPLASQRYTRTLTLTDPTTDRVTIVRRVFVAAGVTVDFTIRYGWPQLELGPFASTPILPPPGAPGVATRGPDILPAPLSALGIGENGACTVLWAGRFGGIVPTDSQTIVALDNGIPGSFAGSNRIDIRIGNTGVPQVIRVTAGIVGITGIGTTPITPGAIIRAGMTIDGAGRVAAVFVGFNGGNPAVLTGAPTGGLDTFRVGSSVASERPMSAETALLRVIAGGVPDAALQSLVASLPV